MEKDRGRKIRVGVDARILSGSTAGIARYLFELCMQLSAYDDVDLILYTPQPLRDEFSKLNSMKIVCEFLRPSFLSTCYWFEYALPKRIFADKLNVFWSPAHRIPFFMPKNVPSVLTIHDLVYLNYPKTMHFLTRLMDKLYIPVSVKIAKHIVPVSNFTKKELLSAFNVDARKMTTVYNGVTSFPKIESSAVSEQKYILFVGTLEPRKNLETLLKAYAKLPVELRDQNHLYIVGKSGWGNKNTAEIITNLGLTQHVQIKTNVSDAELHRLYQSCLFLAMPSLYEGFGLPLVEAMSYGKPVLTSDYASMPEIAGEGGVFVNPQSVDSVYQGMLALMTDPSLYQKKQEGAKKSVARFNWQASASQLRKVLHDAVHERSTC